MDNLDRFILNRIQDSFPLHERPYYVLGVETGVSEAEVWQRVQNLKTKGIIRRIGGIFDSRSLGYVSTLCAAKVPSERIQVLADVMGGIQEITHNYLRDHAYNMWFTIIAASYDRLEQIIKRVKKELNSNEVYSLPAKRVFKIEVNFHLNDVKVELNRGKNLNSRTPVSSRTVNALRVSQVTDITEEGKALIRLLQEDLPNSLTPLCDMAEQLHTDIQKVIDQTKGFLELGVMRRIGAVLVHHKAGFTANAMGVWIVPPDRIEQTGAKMAEFKEVSHCYERPALPDWPYNLFTMVHGQSVKECEEIMERISRVTKIRDYSMLFSQLELKKSSMRYFVEEQPHKNII
ncbi:MAG: Lrp/AsnC family transcriptional regulator [Peptococcaceae bacterium]|nr:Lrp/AsnC family transcriptional regulator [Peptococcaceae bacterium]